MQEWQLWAAGLAVILLAVLVLKNCVERPSDNPDPPLENHDGEASDEEQTR